MDDFEEKFFRPVSCGLLIWLAVSIFVLVGLTVGLNVSKEAQPGKSESTIMAIDTFMPTTNIPPTTTTTPTAITTPTASTLITMQRKWNQILLSSRQYDDVKPCLQTQELGYHFPQ